MINGRFFLLTVLLLNNGISYSSVPAQGENKYANSPNSFMHPYQPYNFGIPPASGNSIEILTVIPLMYLLHDLAQNSAEGKQPLIGLFDKNMIKTVAYLGVAGCVLKLSLGASSGLPHKVSQVLNKLKNIGGALFNRICNRSVPLHVEQLIMWENIVESYLNALCDQSASGNVMLRNMRVRDDGSENNIDDNWIFLVHSIKEIFSHITNYLHTCLPYYEEHTRKYALGTKWLVVLTDSFSAQEKASIIFILNMIAKNLDHVITVCEHAESIDDIDISYIKKISRTTLLLFKKLRILIGGNARKSEPASALPSFNTFEQNPQAGGILDF